MAHIQPSPWVISSIKNNNILVDLEEIDRGNAVEMSLQREHVCIALCSWCYDAVYGWEFNISLESKVKAVKKPHVNVQI